MNKTLKHACTHRTCKPTPIPKASSRTGTTPHGLTSICYLTSLGGGDKEYISMSSFSLFQSIELGLEPTYNCQRDGHNYYLQLRRKSLPFASEHATKLNRTCPILNFPIKHQHQALPNKEQTGQIICSSDLSVKSKILKYIYKQIEASSFKLVMSTFPGKMYLVATLI